MAELASMYRAMLRIRAAENALARMYAAGSIPGFIHLSVGQEAVAAGIAAALEPTDTLATTHRGHGHVLAKGLDLQDFFCEVLGRDAGVCRGRGGSMHVADMRKGIIGANGIVAAGIPIALGTALAFKRLKRPGVAVAVFGDGAMAEGVLHESLNLAALQRLPLVFVCENNGWSEFSRTERQVAARLADLAAAFGIDCQSVDGNDVEAVFAAASRAVAGARRCVAQVLECRTVRARGHYEGDRQDYRADGGMDATQDPLVRARERLLATGADLAQVDAWEVEARQAVDAALEVALASPAADFDAAHGDVYSRGLPA